MQRPILWQIPQPVYDNQQIEALRLKLDERLNTLHLNENNSVFTTRLSVEDMVITDAIARLNLPIKLVVLDTGMLNDETVKLIEQTKQFFSIYLCVYRPTTEEVETFIKEHGKYAMYESLELRKACCAIRKLQPLNRALKDAEIWLTGQRRGQSSTRAHLTLEELDEQRHLVKFNPIFDFSEEDVWAYAHAYQLPINPLYEKGYPSIGCAPCSKAVKAGDDIRSGRWWWENASNKECGLHTH